MSQHHCSRCGGTLAPSAADPNRYQCMICGKELTTRAAEQNTQSLQAILDEAKQEMVHNLRRKLYDAVSAEYISRTEVLAACDELRTYLPDDFAAGFYKVAAGKNARALNQAIDGVDVEAHYDDVGLMVEFLVKSLSADADCLLSLNNLVERAYKSRDLRLFSKYATLVSAQAEKVQEGVYETAIPRKVFVAYSSKDMDRVSEVVEALEEQGISCFVAVRNLRHGVGSVENYEAALRQAMDSCRIFLFVSSLHSRNMNCDALSVEMAYVKKQDIAGALAEQRYDYASIPHACKKPRVEYRVEESGRFNIADTVVDEFFGGYERVYDVEGLLRRVAGILLGARETAVKPQPLPKSSPAPIPTRSNDVPSSSAAPAFAYDVRLISFGKAKLQCIAVLKDSLGLGLKEAKELAEAAPTIIARNRSHDEAELLRLKLREVGASAVLVKAGGDSVVPVSDPASTLARTATSVPKPASAPASKPATPPKTVPKPAAPSAFCRVRLFSYGAQKQECIKIIAELLGSDMLEAKKIVDAAPVVVQKTLPRESAEEICRKLREAGAVADCVAEENEIRATYASTPASKPSPASGDKPATAPKPAPKATAPAMLCRVRLFSYGAQKQECIKIIAELLGSDMLEAKKIVDAAPVVVQKTLPRESAEEICRKLREAGAVADCVAEDNEGRATYGSAPASKPASTPASVSKSAPNALPTLEYKLTEKHNGYAVAGRGTCTDSDLIIPGTYKGWAVDEIGPEAFRMTALKGVTVSEGVSRIGQRAFYGCAELTRVTLPKSIRRIEEEAFSWCPALADLSLPTGLSIIEKEAFLYCTGLAHVTVPEGVVFLGESAFDGCTGLSRIDLPNSITTMGERVFSDCSGLSSITIPNGVSGIGKSAFNCCAELSRVTLPAGLTSIGENAFFDCVKLASIPLPNGLSEIGTGAFSGCIELSRMTIPESVTSIGAHAFVGCEKLTNMTIPGKISRLNDGVFSACAELASIHIPVGVTYIGQESFADCRKLAAIHYAGTKKQWKAIVKGRDWNKDTGNYTVHCADGELKPFFGMKP